MSKSLVVHDCPINLKRVAERLSSLTAQTCHADHIQELGQSEQPLNRQEHEQVLVDATRHGLQAHTLPPAALGLSHCNTAHKASALLHAMSLEVPADAFRERLRCVLSVTGDLGVEIGIPGFSSPLQELMPTWRRQWFEDLAPDMEVETLDVPMDCPPLLNDDIDFFMQVSPSPSSTFEQCGLENSHQQEQVMDGKEVQTDRIVTSGASSSEHGDAAANLYGNIFLREAVLSHPNWEHIVMPYAMAVPGMLHISGNLLEDVTNSLSHWRVFWPQLKNFASLITIVAIGSESRVWAQQSRIIHGFEVYGLRFEVIGLRKL